MTFPYRALFLDLDGTLLNSSSQISIESLNALEKASLLGTKVVICTGRPIPSVRRVMRNASFRYAAISLNGTVIHTDAHESPTAVYPIVPDIVHGISKVLSLQGTAIQNIAFDGVENWFFTQSQVPPLFSEMYDSTPNILTLPFFDTNESVLNIFVEMHKRENFSKILRSEFGNHVAITNYEQFPLIEIAPLGRSKGVAVAELCSFWNISREHTIAFGDGENDIEMLKEVGHAVVMDNALPWVKNHAHHIAPSNDEHGVAQTIESLLAMPEAK